MPRGDSAGSRRIKELETLNAIAETLNRSVDLRQALDDTLKRVVELMGLKTGWVFLVDGPGIHFSPVAAEGLPPALCRDDQKPLREGTCWCQDRFRAGRLSEAVNIIECSRLETAEGDRGGLVYHASVPLKSKDRMLGILNVASPGRDLFTHDVLQLLSAVGHQMGTAIERAQLFEGEQQRARQFEILNSVGHQITANLERDRVIREVARLAAETFSYPYVALYLPEDGTLRLAASYRLGRGEPSGEAGREIHPDDPWPVAAAWRHGEPLRIPDIQAASEWRSGPFFRRRRACLAVPLVGRDEPLGILEVASERVGAFGSLDLELVRYLAAHAAIALGNAELYGRRRELAALAERNRLARELHDSVSQTLFSINLNTQVALTLVEENPAGAAEALRQLQQLAQEALAEMRSLIHQLRPPDLAGQSLTEALRKQVHDFGTRTGIAVEFSVEGDPRPSPEEQQALYRILQEALHNVQKHAEARMVTVSLGQDAEGTGLEVRDDGRGFLPHEPAGRPGHLGLVSMKERAEAVGGVLEVDSIPGEGTRIRVRLPQGR